MFLKDYEYNYLKECKSGSHDDDLLLIEFQKFFQSEFDVYLYGFICDEAGGFNRLRYFVDADKRNVFIDMAEGFGNRDRVKEEKIKAKFSELCANFGKFELFLKPEDYFAIHDEFEYEMKKEILDLCSSDIRDYLGSVEEIKLIDFYYNVLFVFYELDEDVSRYDDGLSREIREHVYGMIKEHDYLDVYKKPQVVFDSVQTLNEKFDGKLFNYHR